MIADETLAAYLDGEATPEQARRIDAALIEDADLRARLDRLRQGDDAVRAAMDSLLDQPVPDRLLRAVRAASDTAEQRGKVVAFPQRRALARQVLWPSAIAAALVGGVMVGRVIDMNPAGSATWIAGPSGPTAGKSMAAALSTARSGASVTLASGENFRPVMTFESGAAGLCRQFELSGTGSRQGGLACRSGGDAWRLAALVTLDRPQAGGGYHTAAGPGEDPVSAMADRLISGEPMDAAAEAAALRRR